MVPVNKQDIAKMIDHSLLHPTLDDEALRAGIELAKKYQVASVCIKPYAVELAARLLEGTDIKVGTVVGFPHGSSTIDVKVFEAQKAIADGAVEVDMVVNTGKVLSEDWEYVEKEIGAVSKLTKSRGVVLKVIFENDFLPEDRYKIKLCTICSRLKAEFVKTSTGYGFVKQPDGRYAYEGATEHDLRLMRSHSDKNVGVKAAGGVRTLEDVLKVKELGVTRIGATATGTILDAIDDQEKGDRGEFSGKDSRLPEGY